MSEHVGIIGGKLIKLLIERRDDIPGYRRVRNRIERFEAFTTHVRTADRSALLDGSDEFYIQVDRRKANRADRKFGEAGVHRYREEVAFFGSVGLDPEQLQPPWLKS